MGSYLNYKRGKELRDKEIIQSLSSHPNYKEIEPKENESILEFSLRYIAELISPEQIEGESNNIECVDLKSAFLSEDLRYQIEKRYYEKTK